MSLQIKKGITAHNPRAVTDGLIFYLDPNNAKCRSANGLKFTDLIQKYSDVTDLSAGIVLAKSNPLTAIDSNIFLTLTGSNSLSGVVGPDNELNTLESFTVQFWIKNNTPTSSFKNIFCNDNINLPNLQLDTRTAFVSTNYPYSPKFGTIGINGVYNREVGLVNGKAHYRRRNPNTNTTIPFSISWDDEKQQWQLSNGPYDASSFPIHFRSLDNVESPTLGTWELVLTAFKFNTGDMPGNFFGNSSGNIFDIFYPTFSGTNLIEYRVRPYSDNQFSSNDFNYPRVTKLGNTPWKFFTSTYGSSTPPYTAVNTLDNPWDSPVFNFNSNLSALSSNTNLRLTNINLTGGWVYLEMYNNRPAYIKDFSQTNAEFATLGQMYYEEYMPGSWEYGPGWFVADFTGSTTTPFLLSASSTSTYPWEVERWDLHPEIFISGITPFLTAVEYRPPPITAVPIYPEDFSNISLILSSDFLEVPRKGLYLSGTNNSIKFTYNDTGLPLPFSTSLFQTNTADWNCITLSQFKNKITLYKNSSFQTVTNTSVEFFNLSSISLGNDITLGQVFLYNKNLTPTEVRQNYNSFKSRYRITDPLDLPIPNQILNSDFSLDNTYPVMAYDGNYFPQGPYDDSSRILAHYVHNSPLLFEYDPAIPQLFGYRTFANRTFHEIVTPYNILPLGHGLQPRLLKLFGVGTRFGVPNSFYDGIMGNGNGLRTIINTTSFSPTDSQSWVKYGVAQYVPIPIGATKVRFGASFLVQSNDKFRSTNFGGIALSFKKNSLRSYVNIYPVQNQNLPPLANSELILLAGLYSTSTYTDFNADFGQNAMCQWMGPNNSRVKVKRLGGGTRFYDISANNTFDIFNPIDFTVDIPTFSTAGGDSTNGFPDSVCLEMFFAEYMPYLNNDGINSGAIYFRDPFLYFE
jgi:hypothetical protein